MFEWYKKSWSEVIKELDSDSYYGLYDEQVGVHRKKYGENRIIIPSTRSFLYHILMQFKEIWVLFLILCFIALIYFKLLLAAGIVFIVIFLNNICISLEEYKNEKNIKELQRLNYGYARVIRNGRTMKIPADELVVGDIVIIGEGESVLADVRVIEANDLKVDECSVTGEKFLSDKYEPKISDKEISLSDMKNILFKSSTVISGDVTGIVVAVGMETQIANIMKLLLEHNEKRISFKSILNSILNDFARMSLVGILVVSVLIYQWNKDLFYLIKQIFVIGSSAFPVGFCFIVWLISMIIIKELKKNNNVNFKNLLSIEKFSNVSVVCTDKVGGFSTDRMDVAKAYGNSGFIKLDGESLKESIDSSLFRMLNIGLLCNDTKSIDGKIENSKDDLVEISITKFAQQIGISKKEVERNHERIFQISFDTERHIMTTVNKKDKNYRANVKGAVDSIIERCTHIMKNGVEVKITEDDIKDIRDADISMSNDCLSVTGFAYRNFNYEPSLKENIESNLVFVGLIGFENKLKETAEDSIKKAASLSIKPVIITEDSKLTAFAVGKKLGFLSRLQQIISGVEIDNMDDEEFKRIGEKINIFSRINSKHKIKIIEALKSYGYITAMTGWKLTDLPALKISNIGITNTKSNIVKKLCDISIKNIDFMNLLNLIEGSRKIISVMRKILLYIISCSFGFLIFYLMNSIFNGGSQIEGDIFIKSIWFNIVTMFLSSLALVYQYKYETTEYINCKIDKQMIKSKKYFIIFAGFLMAILAFSAFKFSQILGSKFSGNMAFGVLNFCSVIFAYSFSNTKIFKNLVSNFIIFINFVFQIIVIVFMGKFNIIFDGVYWIIIFAFSILWFIFCMFYKLDGENYYMD
ncbi:magnesium-transporting ATPase (P-type) [Clostridium algifaecis]|uniref:Magnesium-transporting ATPase (P-type) n=1 Tax=Clostridium algifaecis TaxID=1472040 RepID=A0ABS4KSJ8_9CLOT|nr:HAD-IC family P-type ATPase [Clostridium algifaecis]MBP2033019.1 magnesium-transporting ATPase (P-type) [Clostridium algifaecis]